MAHLTRDAVSSGFLATHIYLIRHGAHDALGGVLSGRSDIGLNTLGREQARALGERCARLSLCALYTSPTRRARETANIIGLACGLEPGEAADLDEIDFGAWAGRAFAALNSDPAWRAWNAQRGLGRAPGGEAMLEVCVRAERFMSALAARGDDCALVSHGDVLRALIAITLNLGLNDLQNFDCAPGSLSRLTIEYGARRLTLLNEAIT